MFCDRAIGGEAHLQLLTKFSLLKYVFACVGAYAPEFFMDLIHASFYAVTVTTLKVPDVR